MSAVGSRKSSNIKAWEIFEEIKPTSYLANGSGKGTRGRANVAAETTSKSRKAYIAAISKDVPKKTPASTRKTPLHSAMDATNISVATQRNTMNSKSGVSGKKAWISSSSRPTSTSKRIEKPKLFTGSKNWLNKPRVSLKDVVIVIGAYLLIRWLAVHLHVSWS